MSSISIFILAALINSFVTFYLIYILGHRINKVQEFMKKLTELDYETNVFNIYHRGYKEKGHHKIFKSRKNYTWGVLVFCIWIRLDKCYQKELKRSKDFLRPKMWGHWHG